MSHKFTPSSSGAAILAEDISANDKCSRGIRSGLRSDISSVCVDAIFKPLLSPCVCDTVPVCCEAGSFTIGTEWKVSANNFGPNKLKCIGNIKGLSDLGLLLSQRSCQPLRMPQNLSSKVTNDQTCLNM